MKQWKLVPTTRKMCELLEWDYIYKRYYYIINNILSANECEVCIFMRNSLIFIKCMFENVRMLCMYVQNNYCCENNAILLFYIAIFRGKNKENLWLISFRVVLFFHMGFAIIIPRNFSVCCYNFSCIWKGSKKCLASDFSAIILSNHIPQK